MRVIVVFLEIEVIQVRIERCYGMCYIGLRFRKEELYILNYIYFFIGNEMLEENRKLMVVYRYCRKKYLCLS